MKAGKSSENVIKFFVFRGDKKEGKENQTNSAFT